MKVCKNENGSNDIKKCQIFNNKKTTFKFDLKKFAFFQTTKSSDSVHWLLYRARFILNSIPVLVTLELYIVSNVYIHRSLYAEQLLITSKITDLI